MQRQTLGGKLQVFHLQGKQEHYLPLIPNTVYIIGRGHNAQLKFGDKPEYRHISNRHCHIVLRGGHYLISDGSPDGKPSRNGTYVNGKKISTKHQILNPHDTIVLGIQNENLRIRFLLEPVDDGSGQIFTFNKVDNRSTQHRIQPPIIENYQPKAHPQPVNQPRQRAKPRGKGQLSGAGVAAAIADRLGDITTVMLLGAIFYGLLQWLNSEFHSAIVNELPDENLRVAFAMMHGTLMAWFWYAISCGLSAQFPQLSSTTFLIIVVGQLLIAIINIMVKSSDAWFLWLTRASHAGVATFALSRASLRLIPNDKPKLHLEVAALLFILLVMVNYLVGTVLYNELTAGLKTISELRLRLFIVGAIEGALVGGLLLGMLKYAPSMTAGPTD